MKKTFIFLICIYLYPTIFTIAQSNELVDVSSDSTITNKVKIEKVDVATYRLFPTENMWTFIKLNTRNGKMWQVQYDVDGDDRLEVFLNLSSLVSTEKEVNGRFTLYPTKNFYTFMLLDQIDGKVWQVQWAIDPYERRVFPIE